MPENLIRLKTVPGVGNAILWRLLREFGDSDGVFGAPAGNLSRVKGMTPEKAAGILRAAESDPRPELEKALRAGVAVIPYDDPNYPKPLLHTFDPPVVLYVRGALTPEDQVAVGIVGTRRATPYGRDSAMEFASSLARGGYTVVSGLALGIDTFAHIGALSAGGRTIGVLGCGFDHMYPGQNRDLALEMSRSGAVISEFPMHTRPSRETFPARNRIIAGLSLGVLVIEAPIRSGSLITARLANEIGRTVFALPGRVGEPGHEGCNRLIRDGAVIATRPDDIFTELNPSLSLPKFSERSTRRKEREKAEIGRLFHPGAVRNSGPEPPPDGKISSPAPSQLFEAATEPGPKPTPAGEAAAAPAVPAPKLSGDQQKLLGAVGDEWRSADDLSAAAGLPAGKTAALLGLLRMQRLVEQGPGQMYRRRRSGR
ncbi:MAG: DNA-processing protein DprA [Planctomycetota bacterium]|jgi:DNA processing protein|nr:DNA-processing protein DprA [Planctomycetota bacterium]